VDEVLDDPRHPYLKALLAALPSPEKRPLPLTSLDMADPRNPPPGCAFHPRCPHRQARCEMERPPLEGGVACFFPQ
jgi:oligopeptide/dipeptide ABC transporter ATP-binding protein